LLRAVFTLQVEQHSVKGWHPFKRAIRRSVDDIKGGALPFVDRGKLRE
jgi:hypothetical protein